MTVSFIMIAIFYVALFSWLSVVGWARQRRMECEAHYRQQIEKDLIEKNQHAAEQIIRLRRQLAEARWLQRREGVKLGGLITTAIGVGMVVALRLIDTGGRSLDAIGWIPFAVGVVLLLYAYVLYPRFMDQGNGGHRLPPDDQESAEDDR